MRGPASNLAWCAAVPCSRRRSTYFSRSRHRHALLSCVHAYILNTSRLFWLSLAILRNWLSYSIQGLEMNRIFMYYIPPPPGPAPGFISFLLHSFCSCCTVDNVLSIYLYILGFLIKYPLFKVELYNVACKYCCCFTYLVLSYGTIRILHKHWTWLVGSEIGHFCLLTVLLSL